MYLQTSFSSVLHAAVSLLLGTVRTLIGVPISLVKKKPIRIDIPVPGFPIDVVLVSEPDQIQVWPPLLFLSQLPEQR